MTPELEVQQVSLSDAYAESEKELNEAPITQEAREPTSVDLPDKVPEVPAWEAPAWTQRWKPESRDALGRFASNPEYKPQFDALLKELENTNGYVTRRDQEYADYKKRLDPVYDILRPYEQRYALQGMSLNQGVQQLFQAAELLAERPDDAFPWLAGTYRPHDPTKALSALAKQWGVDLADAGYDQPYIDPSVTALLSPMQQQMQQMQGYIQQQQQATAQAQQASVFKEISAFEDAVDDNGQPLHPHFKDVFEDMLALVEMGKAQDIPTAYKLATQYNPAIQEKSMAQKIEDARKKAIEEASARTAEANKAEHASRTIGGKTKNSVDGLTLKEAYESSKKELNG